MATDLAGSTRIERRDGLLASELSPTELVMLDIAEGNYFGFEGVAKTIWDALEEPHTVDELVGHVRDTYGDAPESVESDVTAFVQELLDASLAAISG